MADNELLDYLSCDTIAYLIVVEMLRLRQVDHCGLLPADQFAWLAWFVHVIDLGQL